MTRLIFVCVALGAGTALLWKAHCLRMESLGYRRVAITVSVADENGNPVSGIPVAVWTMGDSPLRSRQVFRRISSRDGRVSVRGWALSGVGCTAGGKKYYRSCVRRLIEFAGMPKGAKPVVDFQLRVRGVRNPVPMRVGNFSAEDVRLRAQFDLLKGDFLPPYGRGETADVTVAWERAGGDGPKMNDAAYELLFENGADGLAAGQVCSFPGTVKSDLLSDYMAPASGYTNHVRYSSTRVGTPFTRWGVWYFRIRTRTDLAGVVTNAIYGKFYGTPCRFRYYVNPVPNDRNVEAATGKNLMDLTDYDFMP